MNKNMTNGRKLWALRAVTLLAAVVCIIFGISRGEQLTVLQKAVNICLQCIGIG